MMVYASSVLQRKGKYCKYFICNIINLLVTVADQQYVIQWFHLLSIETATGDYCTTE